MFDSISRHYDFLNHFLSLGIDILWRKKAISLLRDLQPKIILDVATGTGDFSIEALSLKPEKIIGVDISEGMLEVGRQKMRKRKIDSIIELRLGDSENLPFTDNFFDAAHHFGGINTFSDIPRCLSELARVVKPGGKVVIGDEGLGPWLSNTEMGRIMANSNPLLKCAAPMQLLPTTATDVKLEYIMMSAFYVIEFTVVAEMPLPDYHMQIPSARGGSHWTRYYGQLEGVSDEAKQLAHEARKQAGLSMHDWLDRAVRDAAKNELQKKST